MRYSKSRKVNSLVKLTLQFETVSKKRNVLGDDILVRRGLLTGGQMAEYLRILRDMGL